MREINGGKGNIAVGRSARHISMDGYPAPAVIHDVRYRMAGPPGDPALAPWEVPSLSISSGLWMRRLSPVFRTKCTHAVRDLATELGDGGPAISDWKTSPNCERLGLDWQACLRLDRKSAASPPKMPRLARLLTERTLQQSLRAWGSIDMRWQLI